MVSAHRVNELFIELKAYYSSAHNQMEHTDRLFNQIFDGIVDVPYDVRIFKSSTGTNIVEGFRNQIRTNEPTVDFNPAGPSVKAEKHATLMQRWGYGMMQKERDMAVIDPNLQNGFDLLLRGAACKKITVDVDAMMEKAPKRGTNAYAEWEFKALRTWPYVVRAIDPLAIFPSPFATKGTGFIIERQIRYASQISQLYPNWINPDKKKSPTRRIEWLEYWDKDDYTAVADGNEVFVKKNPYGLYPYVYEYSGLGRAHADADPVHLAVGILTGIEGELEEEVRLKTAISVQTQMHVFPPILTVEDPIKVAKQYGVGPGKIIRHAPGHPPVYMDYPAPNENFYRFLDTIQQNISRVFSPALSGSRDSGVRFGVLQAQMIGQALTTIAPIRATLDSMGTQTLNMMASMARKLDLSMAIEGTREPVEAPFKVSGSDFTHQNFHVTFEAIDPAENDRALLVGQALRRNNDISRETFWEHYAKDLVEDPDEENTRLLTERTLDLLAESGELIPLVLAGDEQAQIDETAAGAVDRVTDTIQNRRSDTTPVGAAGEARELEAISGTPGSQAIPADTARRGMAASRPSNTGLVSR